MSLVLVVVVVDAAAAAAAVVLSNRKSDAIPCFLLGKFDILDRCTWWWRRCVC